MAIIEVNNLGKKYYLGERMSQRSILDSLKTTAKMPYRLARTLFTGETGQREAFWALKDVSFKVEEGEVLGIIGRNGAGKSTLLKILSRIVAPTEGEIILNGRVGSLLEVGTGFHPELTGRENIFMNGSLLGMSHAEISKHFDEIVDFSGVEKFLDTPVKFYSSGMYTRLAFSVAAHLRTEILIIDEVLAVGDTEFQKKCLNKMDTVAKSGRTILFVSHNMNAIKSICNKICLLQNGSIAGIGRTIEVIDKYLDKHEEDMAEVIYDVNKPGDFEAVLHSVRVKNSSGQITSTIQINEPFQIELKFELLASGMRVYPNLHFKDSLGSYVCVTSDSGLDQHCEMKQKTGCYTMYCQIPGNLLNSGKYHIGVALTSIRPTRVHLYEQDVIIISIIENLDKVPTRHDNDNLSPIPGAFRPLLDWHFKEQP